MSALDKVRVSFIGAGGICEQRHLPGLAQIPGVELVAVCNRSAESSERIKQKWNFERIESDWRKVIDDPIVDAIFIGTWPYMHCELSIAALNAGKHVFCQARMCMDWNEAQQMTAAAAAHPQQVNTVCPSPFRVRWERTVKQVLASPEFGPLQAVAASSVSAANAVSREISWRERIEFSGLNILQVGIFAETLNAWCGEYLFLEANCQIPLRDKHTGDGQIYQIRVPQLVGIRGRLTSGASANEYHSGLKTYEQSGIDLIGKDQRCHISLQGENAGVELEEESGTRNIIDAIGDPWQVEAEFIVGVRSARRDEPWKTTTQINHDFFAAARYMRKMQVIHDSAAAGGSAKLLDEQPPAN